MIEFCEKWFFAKGRPVKTLSTNEAKLRHSGGHTYCAVIGGFASPTHIVSLAGEWVSVDFFDDLGRAFLNYDFKKTDGRLFLSAALFRDYEGVSSNITRSTAFSFTTDGSVVMAIDENNTMTESGAKAGTEPNWAEFPDFGEYTALCNENRIGSSEPI